MLSKTDRLIQQQIARYFSRLSVATKIGLLTRTPSVNMNEDEEADANDLASEVETDWTRQKIRRDLAKFRRRLQERVQLLLSQIVATIEPLRFFAYMRLSKREICHSYKKISEVFHIFHLSWSIILYEEQKIEVYFVKWPPRARIALQV